MQDATSPIDEQHLPLLPKEQWDALVFTIIGARNTVTRFGKRIAIDVAFEFDTEFAPAGTEVCILLGVTEPRQKIVTYFAEGKPPVGPCQIHKSDAGVWIITKWRAPRV